MDTAVKIVQLLSPAITITFGLVAFGLGLLAWRQQLLDKRKFEIAEEAMVLFATVAEALRQLRQRNGWDGMHDFIATQNPGRSDYRWHMARREWIYRLDPRKLEDFEKAQEDLAPIRVLARLYLSSEIADCLGVPRRQFMRVRAAAKDLSRIDPRPPSDAVADYSEEPMPDPDYDTSENELSNEDELEIEKRALLHRFEGDPFDDDGPEDRIGAIMTRTTTELKELCSPYMDINPYGFLKRLFQSLRPGHRAIPK